MRVATPPVLHQTVFEDARQARKLGYVKILLEEGGVDPKRVAPGDAAMAMASPYEERGYGEADIARWIADCDPPGKITWDPVECFRGKAKAAMRPRPGLGTELGAIAAVAFFAAFALAKWRR